MEAERHERMQAITGIPWYYRQFGYEMALNLDGGRRYRPHIPRLKDGETEPYRVRPVTAADLPCIRATRRARQPALSGGLCARRGGQALRGVRQTGAEHHPRCRVSD